MAWVYLTESKIKQLLFVFLVFHKIENKSEVTLSQRYNECYYGWEADIQRLANWTWNTNVRLKFNKLKYKSLITRTRNAEVAFLTNMPRQASSYYFHKIQLKKRKGRDNKTNLFWSKINLFNFSNLFMPFFFVFICSSWLVISPLCIICKIQQKTKTKRVFLRFCHIIIVIIAGHIKIDYIRR